MYVSTDDGTMAIYDIAKKKFTKEEKVHKD